MTASALEAAARDCAEIAATAYEKGQLPSLSAGVFRLGNIEWRADLGDVSSQYRIGSITKTFTAVAVMRLVERGRIGLDDPIGLHLPDAPYFDHPVARLLCHSSGMTAEPAGEWWERTPGRSWTELVQANDTNVAVFSSGERHHYSNLAYGLLGELVARLEGMPWWDVVESKVLQPLGLTETSYLPQRAAAIGTSRDPRDGRLLREPAHDAGAMAPAGQLWSTVDNLARWADFLTSEGDSVLGRRALESMRIARTADPVTQHRGAYGLGLRLHWRTASTLVGHTGSMPGFLAGVFVDPASRVGAVVLANATTGLEPERVVAALVDAWEPGLLEAAPAAPTGPADSARREVDELAGEWYWGNTAILAEATPTGFSLSSEQATRHFVREGVDLYRGQDGYFAGEALHVVRREEGTVSHLEVVTFIFTRVPYDPTAPIPGGPPEPLT